MAISKATLYGKVQRKAAQIAKAVSHPARIFILNQLADGPLEVCVIMEDHPLADSTFSQHLKILRIAGLVRCDSYGMNCTYESLPENQPRWLVQLLHKTRTNNRFASAA